VKLFQLIQTRKTLNNACSSYLKNNLVKTDQQDKTTQNYRTGNNPCTNCPQKPVLYYEKKVYTKMYKQIRPTIPPISTKQRTICHHRVQKVHDICRWKSRSWIL